MGNERPTGCVHASFASLGGATALAGLLIAIAEKRRAGQVLLPSHETSHAARQLTVAAATLATAVLADSTVEHYRGEFHNRAMWTPLLTSALTLAATLHGAADRRVEAHPCRDMIYAIAGLTGLAGTGFHLYNIGRQPGGFCAQNLFYKAPLGAPAALTLAGLMGVLAERVRNIGPGRSCRFLGVPLARLIAAITSVGLLGTSAEAGLLHFRGAFHNPFMLLPVTAPPVSALLLGQAAVGDARRRPFARGWLRFTAWIGVIGSAFHAVGISRAMGGWANWRQNVVDGPPLPAPPSFTGLAIAGLAALSVLEVQGDAG